MSQQIYQIDCPSCNKTRNVMREKEPSKAEICGVCVENQKWVGHVTKPIDGAPAGFVKGGVSNKAGFANYGQVFQGNPATKDSK